MRKFNRGYALVFLIFILLAVGAVWFSYQRVEGVFQSEAAQYAEYTIDDWLQFFRLDEVLGDPPVTPFPVDELPPPVTTGTPVVPEPSS